VKLIVLENYVFNVEYLHSAGLRRNDEVTILSISLFTPRGVERVEWRSDQGNDGTVRGFLTLVKEAGGAEVSDADLTLLFEEWGDDDEETSSEED
jgi:hypothetical protein